MHDETIDRRTFLRASTAALITVGYDGRRSSAHSPFVANELSSLANATAWINSSPIAPSSLAGRVVLVQFWTFTCINWIRTLPYLRDWAARYRDAGLVTIGVHAPEFQFEHDLANVRRAATAMRVSHPSAIDNDFVIWRAFGNRYWPALYLFDGTGRVRHRQFGEGGYAESERAIRELLTSAGTRDLPQSAPIEGRGVEAPADWDDQQSPENYLGSQRTDRFTSPGGIVLDRAQRYTLPAQLPLNHWALAGDWTVGKQASKLTAPNGRIATRFHSRDLHLVMGPPTGTRAVRYRVLLDGKPPGAAHGGDVDATGAGVATEQRLYQLIRQPKPIVDRAFEIEFLDAGVEGYAFTFG